MKDIKKDKAGLPLHSNSNQPTDQDSENSEPTSNKPKSNGLPEQVVKKIPENRRVVAGNTTGGETKSGTEEKDCPENDK